MTCGIDRRRFTFGSAGLVASACAVPAVAQPSSESPVGSNVLRILFESAETGFDPAQTSDLYSTRVQVHIFEALRKNVLPALIARRANEGVERPSRGGSRETTFDFI